MAETQKKPTATIHRLVTAPVPVSSEPKPESRSGKFIGTIKEHPYVAAGGAGVLAVLGYLIYQHFHSSSSSTTVPAAGGTSSSGSLSPGAAPNPYTAGGYPGTGSGGGSGSTSSSTSIVPGSGLSTGGSTTIPGSTPSGSSTGGTTGGTTTTTKASPFTSTTPSAGGKGGSGGAVATTKAVNETPVSYVTTGPTTAQHSAHLPTLHLKSGGVLQGVGNKSVAAALVNRGYTLQHNPLFPSGQGLYYNPAQTPSPPVTQTNFGHATLTNNNRPAVAVHKIVDHVNTQRAVHKAAPVKRTATVRTTFGHAGLRP